MSEKHLMEEVHFFNLLVGLDFQKLYFEARFLKGDFQLLVVAERGVVRGDYIAQKGDNHYDADVGKRNDRLAFPLEALPRERRQGYRALFSFLVLP